MRIYLIGYMASGKSGFGKLLAGRIGYHFIDLDKIFEERFRIGIPDFFSKYDENAFRLIERTLLMETTAMDQVVVSTGGGTPCFFDNLAVIKNAGISVYLKWEVPALVRRLKQAKHKRPLLKHIPDDHLEEKITQHLTSRSVYYEKADLVLMADRLSAEQMMTEIVGRIDSSGFSA